MTSDQIVHLYTLLLIVVFGTSGNAQVRKNLPKEKVSEPKIISVGQPKLMSVRPLSQAKCQMALCVDLCHLPYYGN